MHIDAAWGGGLLMSEKYKALRFDGVHRADSLTWNPHKLLGALLQCSTFHLKESGILHDCNKMGAQMDRMMGLTKYQICRMKDMSEKFYLLEEDPQCVNVCFWYLPKRFRGTPMTAEKKVELGKVTAQLKKEMMNAGTLMVSYQPLGNIPNFFRSILSNPATREEDIDFMLDEMERLGKDL